MFNLVKHLFLPRHSNNQRARLIHNQIILAVALLLVGASFLVQNVRKNAPSVLGVSVDISSQELLNLTNQDRIAAGLQPLNLNGLLSVAAENKAQNMFAENYWAHYAPDGKSPWDFIKAAGYNYVYAGENLARGFTTSSSVVNAWMASPDHRANMLSNNYTDVGFAVAQGSLTGDTNTVLVVEMFGSRSLGVVPQKAPSVATTVETPQVASVAAALQNPPKPTEAPVLASVQKQPLLNSALLTKSLSLVLLSLFLVIFGLDVVITENRKTVRLAGHSFDHLLFLLGILLIAISLGLGLVG